MDMLRAHGAILCLERRKQVRTKKDGWQRSEICAHSWQRSMHGHHLIIHRPTSIQTFWYMWLDGRLCGKLRTLTLCQQEMENKVLQLETSTLSSMIVKGEFWDVAK